MNKKIFFSYLPIFFINFFLIENHCSSEQKMTTSSNKKPIEISADNGIEWHKNERKYIALGNARAQQGDLVVNSDKLEAYYVSSNQNDDNIHTIKALGNVKIKNKSAIIKGGEKASYILDKEYFIINGKNLTLNSKEDNLSANRKIEFWKSENIAVATGNAIAKKKNEYTISANKLAWYLDLMDGKEDYKIKKIIGFENVKIESENEIAFSDKALYNGSTELCKLFGNVRLKRGNNFLTGDYAEVNLKTGISKLLPNPNSILSNTEKKVKALISKENNDGK